MEVRRQAMTQETWQVRKAAASGRGGMVASQHAVASEIGAEVLREGGNAVDAALAASLALGVLEPWMSGLGGGGFMLIARPDGGPVECVDFGMVAPIGLDPADYPLALGRDADLFGWPAVEGARNVHGPLAIAVPTEAAGLGLAHRLYARMPWAELCRPAIALARDGLPVGWYGALRIAAAAREIAPFEEARRTYLPDGLPPVPGADGSDARLPLGRLSQTLERLAEAGPADLVNGDLARLLVEDVQAAGGRLSSEDLRRYEARRLDALAIPYGGASIHAAPGLTAGPTLAHTLSLLAGRVPARPPGAEAYLAWAEALLAAYEARLAGMGHAGDAQAQSCTTHLCVLDRDGAMVSLTQTLLSVFGSKVISPQTGILLNNGIMWFDPRPGRPNSIAPGARPLSNICPVIASRDGRPWFALGASGGRRILPAVLQIASMLADCGLDLESAFHVPRIDVSGEAIVLADTALPAEVRAALVSRFETRPAPHLVLPNLFACPSAVLREPSSGRAFGMSDVVQPVAGVATA
jgi:gamma-glutamyltranspeptidase/glutathione hydrolase